MSGSKPIMNLLEVKDLEVCYPGARSFLGRDADSVKAVRRVSFDVVVGETLGVVGESGCGKSSIARSLVLLNRPSGGSIEFKGSNILNLSGSAKKSYRRAVQMIFQDPYGSLNPKLTVGESVAEGMEVHGLFDSALAVRSEVIRLLDRVGLDESAVDRYPKEFSGGQRQRIGIARALAVRPELIVCDEPVSALDVSVQAQIVNLLQILQKDSGLSYLFITHDLAVVEHLSHRILVMYLGQVVEEGPASLVVGQPKHPYTQALVAAVPGGKNRNDGGAVIKGDVPSPLNPPAGCAFHSRCPFAEARCRTIEPSLEEIDPGHRVACHLVLPRNEWKKDKEEKRSKMPER
jgi:oligopeptide transport system ATP-binding protein